MNVLIQSGNIFCRQLNQDFTVSFAQIIPVHIIQWPDSVYIQVFTYMYIILVDIYIQVFTYMYIVLVDIYIQVFTYMYY